MHCDYETYVQALKFVMRREKYDKGTALADLVLNIFIHTNVAIALQSSALVINYS